MSYNGLETLCGIFQDQPDLLKIIELGDIESSKLVGASSYNYFGYSAVSLLLTLAHLMTSDIIGGQKQQDIQNSYESLHKTISKKVKKLPSFPNEP